MKIQVLTLFPAMFAGPLSASIVGRARSRGLLDIEIHDIRDYTVDPHRTADDVPYGGGAGMVLKIEPVVKALSKIGRGSSVVLLTPAGELFTQRKAEEFSRREELVLIAGRYEGVDARVREYATEEISVGDFILTGGELPAMIIIDAVSRLIPGVVGKVDSITGESFSSGLLDYPAYTRPEVFDGKSVPAVLLSGDHQKIARWRRKEALRRTLAMKPDMLSAASPEDGMMLKEVMLGQ